MNIFFLICFSLEQCNYCGSFRHNTMNMTRHMQITAFFSISCLLKTVFSKSVDSHKPIAWTIKITANLINLYTDTQHLNSPVPVCCLR